jgi:hypothetical protein
MAIKLLKILAGLLGNSRGSLPCTQNLVTTANPEYLVSSIRTAVMIRAIECTQSPPPDQQVNSLSRHQLISKWIHSVDTSWSASECIQSLPNDQQVKALNHHQVINMSIHSVVTNDQQVNALSRHQPNGKCTLSVAIKWSASQFNQSPPNDQQVNALSRHQLIGKCMLSVAIKWSASEYTQSPPND